MNTGFLLTRALGWYYSAVNVLRPRSTSDRVIIGPLDQLSTATVIVDNGSHNTPAIATRGCALFSRLALLPQEATLTGITVPASLTHAAATDLTANCAFLMYMRNGSLIFASNCGGSMRYLRIHLDGQSCTWTQSSTAP